MPTVLIADDEASLRLLVSATLAASGWDLIQASNGDDAWTLLAENKPEVAVLDVNMPGRNGLDLVHLIRAEPDLARMRVILLSGLDDPDEVSAGRKAGADLYLTKPFSPVTLLHAVTCDFAIEAGSGAASPSQGGLQTRSTEPARAGARQAALTVSQDEPASADSPSRRPQPKRKPPRWPAEYVDDTRLWELLGYRDEASLANPVAAQRVGRIERRLSDAFQKGLLKRYVARDPVDGSVVAHAYRRQDVRALFAGLLAHAQ